MSWLDGLSHRIRTLLRAGDYERELREEMGFHESLDAMQQRDRVRARRRFGNRTWYQEEARRMTWLAAFDTLRQDLSYAWRSIRRTPGVTAMVVLTLALGLGANAATFAVIDRLFLRAPSGVNDPERLDMLFFETSAERSANGEAFISQAASYPDYRVVAAASGNPRSVALYDTDNMLFMGSGAGRQHVRGVFASANYFDVLGVRPAFGRLYTAAEDSLGAGSPVVVISHRFWQSAFAGDSAVLGTKVRIEAEDYTIVGVLQQDFHGMELQAADVWFPLASIPKSNWIPSGRGSWWESERASGFVMLHRAGANEDPGFQHRATLALREKNRRSPVPDTLANVYVSPLMSGGPAKPRQDAIISTRLGWVSGIVLLIACANVINLLLARAVRRRREIAVRLALGISRARLVRLLTVETVLLALMASGVAMFVAWGGGTVLRTLLMPSVEWYESVIHWRVVLYALGVSLLAGVVAGGVPAIQASRPELTQSLKEGARDGAVHRSRLRRGLVVTQAAFSVVLLVGAALFVRSLGNVKGLDIGYDADRLLLADVQFEAGQRQPSAVTAAAISEVASRIRNGPGVEAVARSAYVPMRAISFLKFYWGSDSSLSLRPNSPTYSPVSAEFFRTVGMRIVKGATFENRDGGPRQVVVNEAMAQRVWPAAEAIGQCIRFERQDAPCYTVVGVVENARQSYVIEEPKPLFYMPVDNLPSQNGVAFTLIVRARPSELRSVQAQLTAEMRRAFPTGEVGVRLMSHELNDEYRPWRLGAALFAGFGALALLVAIVGIYSTVSYGVTQRRHEFGVRIALGARLGDVLRQVIGEGLRVVAIGVGVGIALALAAGKLIAALLYGVAPYDPGVMLSVSVILLGAAAAAALLPAWRAARVDPVTALRSE